MSVDSAAKRGIPDATVARLPGYLRALDGFVTQGIGSVSSEELAHSAGVSSAKLRKDLSHLGSYGVRGVGYDVAHLTYQISRALGLTHDWPVLIVGMGNLGRALASYGGFATKGFKVVALLDRDPTLVGQQLDDLRVQPMTELESLVTPGRRASVSSRPPPARRRRSRTGSWPPASARSSTSPPRRSRCPRASTCARSTCRPSCRSSPSTSSSDRAA